MTFRLKVKEMNEPTMENVWGTHDKKKKTNSFSLANMRIIID